jgi:hypothetical protein
VGFRWVGHTHTHPWGGRHPASHVARRSPDGSGLGGPTPIAA